MLNYAKVCIPEGRHEGNKSDRMSPSKKIKAETIMTNKDCILYSTEREERENWSSMEEDHNRKTVEYSSAVFHSGLAAEDRWNDSLLLYGRN